MNEEKKGNVIEKSVLYWGDLGMEPIIKTFVESKRSFVFEHTPSAGSILCKNGTRYDLIYKEKFGGAHLCSVATAELNRREKSGEYVKKYTGEEVPETIFFNTHVINRSSHEFVRCVYIDMDDCYWRTMFLLGIISEHSYKKGLEKKAEYKQGRRAAIGSFNGEKTYEYYENGVKVKEEIVNRGYNYARVHVMNHVFDMAVEIAREVPYAVCMFLTDCFVVYPDYEKYIFDKLEEYGYTAKKHYVWMLGANRIDKRSNIVFWDDEETLMVKSTKPKDYKPHQHYYGSKNELGNILMAKYGVDKTKSKI